MRVFCTFLAGLAAVTLSLSAPAAFAAEKNIGKALAVVDHASAQGQVGKRTLSVGAPVYLGDHVTTDAKGTAQLLFKDGTRMVVGPNSELVLDAFVFRSAAPENQVAMRALSGAFRFITGHANKDAYLINTPSATMGVRGTEFDIAVTPNETSVLLYTGTAAVCGNNAGCTVATGAPE